MTTQTTLDFTESKHRKDVGQEQVISKVDEFWKQGALQAVETAARLYDEFTFDEVRSIAIALGVGNPHHPNAWGALMNRAAKNGWARRTEKFKPSTNPISHSRHLVVWESLMRNQ